MYPAVPISCSVCIENPTRPVHFRDEVDAVLAVAFATKGAGADDALPDSGIQRVGIASRVFETLVCWDLHHSLATTEAETCRKFVLPKLYSAEWGDDQISEQLTFTDGRIMVAGTKVWRRPQKRADYLLRYRPNLMVGVAEAKHPTKILATDFNRPRTMRKSST